MSEERFEVNGYTVLIEREPDGDIGNPREGSNLGVMLANGHRRYTLGDAPFARQVPEYAEAERIVEELTEDGQLNGETVMAAFKERLGATVVLPLWLLDHSGLSMSTGSFISDPGQWDSGVVGFIFDSPRTREECGTPPDRIEEVLRSEVGEYDKFLRGEVYGFAIEDPDGDTVESVCGFLGYEYVESEARSAAEGLPPLQWVVVRGSLAGGMRIEGPYADRELAATVADGQVMLLKPPSHTSGDAETVTRTASIPSSWLSITQSMSAEKNLRLLDRVDEAGVAHDDLDGVRRIWLEMTSDGDQG